MVVDVNIANTMGSGRQCLLAGGARRWLWSLHVGSLTSIGRGNPISIDRTLANSGASPRCHRAVHCTERPRGRPLSLQFRSSLLSKSRFHLGPGVFFINSLASPYTPSFALRNLASWLICTASHNGLPMAHYDSRWHSTAIGHPTFLPQTKIATTRRFNSGIKGEVEHLPIPISPRSCTRELTASTFLHLSETHVYDYVSTSPGVDGASQLHHRYAANISHRK